MENAAALTAERDRLRSVAAQDPRNTEVGQLTETIANLIHRGASKDSAEVQEVVLKRNTLRDAILAPVTAVQEKLSAARKAEKRAAKQSRAAALTESDTTALEARRAEIEGQIRELRREKAAIVHELGTRSSEQSLRDLLDNMSEDQRDIVRKHLGG